MDTPSKADGLVWKEIATVCELKGLPTIHFAGRLLLPPAWVSQINSRMGNYWKFKKIYYDFKIELVINELC
jgi:hypothetical protein